MNTAQYAEIDRILDRIPQDFGGGCPNPKAHTLYDLVITHQMTLSLEIGVYRGRSLLPQAIGQRITGGYVIGVDPYSHEAAREYDPPGQLRTQIDLFIDKWDCNQDYFTLLQVLREEALSDHAIVVRETSKNFARLIENSSLDMLHIDGNHDTERVSEDLVNYIPKVKDGGFIVMDDTDWKSV